MRQLAADLAAAVARLDSQEAELRILSDPTSHCAGKSLRAGVYASARLGVLLGLFRLGCCK